MKKKMKVFWFHFNKPASKKAGKPIISLHYDNTCHMVDNVICEGPTSGKINKRQPHFVVRGYTSSILIDIVTNIARIQY